MTVNVHETAYDTSCFAFVGHGGDVPGVADKSDWERPLFFSNTDLQWKELALCECEHKEVNAGVDDGGAGADEWHIEVVVRNNRHVGGEVVDVAAVTSEISKKRSDVDSHSLKVLDPK